MEPSEFKNNKWKPRRSRMHGLDSTDEQIAPGKKFEDWMSLSATEMDMFRDRSEGDRMLVSALMKKKKAKK